MPDSNQANRYGAPQTLRLKPLNTIMVEPLRPRLEVDVVAGAKGMKRARIAVQAQRLLMNYALGH
ncbi:hypothetical protein C1Y08_03515 [Pseudomonas sp. FW306-02-F02-AA]|uniref:Uncharacterized protein n=1 Tax=Pseudomonas fluorescens TaxID=294 RepID=A0A0N9WHM3_PSEFL|nr:MULTISPECIES: hypothetical protein [Pseudomonas]ALI01487.1 hypothetical protein AO353_10525 [Pseudomonas fluorescens]PMZ05797.1 hypothetical protein C1Y07_02100 [Pseudomonas sp. FW306-02-F02-AB]PMZ11367.1 hypothetical protein C1Y06_03830 [Pseudomonas sp. FW306-02-H06C]PMZ17290.1 hypothetical protein C1Y08_03515 [Pseudomonas sp. FW306-02-F02-AA]PMZ23007.1 hypothetical protein C1Y09_05175 [Pseudomonas sp. FW306-02-F08-AA]